MPELLLYGLWSISTIACLLEHCEQCGVVRVWSSLPCDDHIFLANLPNLLLAVLRKQLAIS